MPFSVKKKTACLANAFQVACCFLSLLYSLGYALENLGNFPYNLTYKVSSACSLA